MNSASHFLRSLTTGLVAAASLLHGTAGGVVAQGHPSTRNEVRQEASSMQDKIGAVIDTGLEFVEIRGVAGRPAAGDDRLRSHGLGCIRHRGDISGVRGILVIWLHGDANRKPRGLYEAACLRRLGPAGRFVQ